MMYSLKHAVEQRLVRSSRTNHFLKVLMILARIMLSLEKVLEIRDGHGHGHGHGSVTVLNLTVCFEKVMVTVKVTATGYLFQRSILKEYEGHGHGHGHGHGIFILATHPEGI
jgi:hypothetical protein